MEIKLRNIPNIVALISGVSFSLSMLHNAIFFNTVDARFLEVMSISDHMSSSVVLLPYALLISSIFLFVFKIFLRKEVFNVQENKRYILKLLFETIVLIFTLLLFVVFFSQYSSPPKDFVWLICSMCVFGPVLGFSYRFGFFKISRSEASAIYFCGIFFFATITFSVFYADYVSELNGCGKHEEQFIINGKSRNGCVVRAFANSTIFYENKRLIYADPNRELPLGLRH